MVFGCILLFKIAEQRAVCEVDYGELHLQGRPQYWRNNVPGSDEGDCFLEQKELKPRGSLSETRLLSRPCPPKRLLLSRYVLCH
jgi:hypothetical protein